MVLIPLPRGIRCQFRPLHHLLHPELTRDDTQSRLVMAMATNTAITRNKSCIPARISCCMPSRKDALIPRCRLPLLKQLAAFAAPEIQADAVARNLRHLKQRFPRYAHRFRTSIAAPFANLELVIAEVISNALDVLNQRQDVPDRIERSIQ